MHGLVSGKYVFLHCNGVAKETKLFDINKDKTGVQLVLGLE